LKIASLFIQKYGKTSWEEFKEFATRFQTKNQIFFNNNELLYIALAVRGSLIPSNEFERLEYLGDSILQALIGSLLFEKFPSFPPEKLTRLRSILVRNKNLAIIGRKMGMGEIGNILNMGLLNDNQIADMFEAVVGALFIDRDDFEAVKKDLCMFFAVENKVQEIESSPWGDKDPKSFLYEILQKKYKNNFSVEYTSINLGTENIPLYQVTLVVRQKDTEEIIDYTVGKFAKKLKDAQKHAAESLLLKWFYPNTNIKKLDLLKYS